MDMTAHQLDEAMIILEELRQVETNPEIGCFVSYNVACDVPKFDFYTWKAKASKQIQKCKAAQKLGKAPTKNEIDSVEEMEKRLKQAEKKANDYRTEINHHNLELNVSIPNKQKNLAAAERYQKKGTGT